MGVGERGGHEVDYKFSFFVDFYYSTAATADYTPAAFSGLNEISPREVIRSRNGTTAR